MIHLDFDRKQLDTIAKELNALPRELHAVQIGAITDTTRQMRTAASREIRSVFAIPATEVSSRISRTPTDKSSVSGRVTIKDKPQISLRTLKPRQRRSGVSYKLKKSGSDEIILSAFGPNIPRLGRSVWKREGKKRLPIVKLPGHSLVKLTQDMSLVPVLEKTGRERLAANVLRRLNVLRLKKHGVISKGNRE